MEETCTLDLDRDNMDYVCSNCGEAMLQHTYDTARNGFSTIHEFQYCPHCGMKVDVENNGEING